MGVARVESSVLERCAQGAEAGYGFPLLQLRRVLLRGNGVGARLGDSYPSLEHGGRLEADSVAFADNGVDVLNQPGEGWLVDSTQIVVRFSQLLSGVDFISVDNKQPSLDAYRAAGHKWPHPEYWSGPSKEFYPWSD